MRSSAAVSVDLAPDLVLRACAASASATERRDCRRRSDADRANIAGTRRRRRARPAAAGSRRRSPIADRPRSGLSSPATSRSVVVLPAPVGPSSTTKPPSSTSSERSSTASDGAEALGDAGKRDVRHARLPREARCRSRGRSPCRTGTASPAGRRGRRVRRRAWRRRPAGARAAGPKSVVIVTIWVVPRYSAPNTAPRSALASSMTTASGRTPRTSSRSGSVLPHRRRGDSRPAEPNLRRARLQAIGECEQVHRRRADEIGDEHARGPVVDLARRSPTCSTTPRFITAIVSAIDIASSWSCVT